MTFCSRRRRKPVYSVPEATEDVVDAFSQSFSPFRLPQRLGDRKPSTDSDLGSKGSGSRLPRRKGGSGSGAGVAQHRPVSPASLPEHGGSAGPGRPRPERSRLRGHLAELPLARHNGGTGGQGPQGVRARGSETLTLLRAVLRRGRRREVSLRPRPCPGVALPGPHCVWWEANGGGALPAPGDCDLQPLCPQSSLTPQFIESHPRQ